jgi:carbonic anhydrase
MYHLFLKMIVFICSAFLVANLAHSSPAESIVLDKTISQDKQQKMTPKQALQRLKDGNQRFLINKLIARDYLKQAKQSSYGQFPFAVVLNCMDSRSVPELIFDQGLADLFTLRVAGNVLNDDILGSMEYATKIVGSRLIVVLAHTSCGAVAGACNDVKLGHITDFINKIKPSVEPGMKETGLKNCEDPKLIEAIAKNNALEVKRQIQERSPILSELVSSKQVGIVAGLHNIKTGEIRFFEEGKSVPG